MIERWFGKKMYRWLGKRCTFPDWIFMNYGYADLDGSPSIPLSVEDEPFRYNIQLYHLLAEQAPLTNKDVVEIGSGKGGGCSYIMQTFKPRQMVGMDLEPYAIDFCKTRHPLEGLSFVCGNAEQMPFEPNSFDVIFNVESCHAYPSAARFFRECHRILRPQGHLLMVDLCKPELFEGLKQKMHSSGLQLITEKDILANVFEAIKLADAHKRQKIKNRIAWWLRPIVRGFSAVSGTKMYRRFESGELGYHMFVLRKPGNHPA
jgi:ubiquinone/menaquinone biosynthesis C-methylase UbiE